MKNLCKSIIWLVPFIFCVSVGAQAGSKINSDIKTKTIENLSKMLDDYVYPEKRSEIKSFLQNNLENGKYDYINDFSEFAETVTSDLYEISNDKHLIIRFAPDEVKEIKESKSLTGEEKLKNDLIKKINSSKDNFGFKEVKIFPSNTGYLKLNRFEKSNYSTETAYAAMEFLSHVDFLIIDLRDNNGGWSSLVQILCSYFFEFDDIDENLLLFEIHIPYKKEITQYRILPHLTGNRMVRIPVYILTSKETYSAAEKFTDVLQKRKRAIVIGEKTKGGANSTRGPEVLNDYFIVKMPVGRTINPVTNSNWEGTGVEPDIKINSEKALEKALQLIVKNQIKDNPDEQAINRLGYAFLGENYLDLGIYIFQENIRLHPESANTYDSMGEAYMLKGDYIKAINNYELSLKINPNNQNAKNMIKRIERLNFNNN